MSRRPASLRPESAAYSSAAYSLPQRDTVDARAKAKKQSLT